MSLQRDIHMQFSCCSILYLSSKRCMLNFKWTCTRAHMHIFANLELDVQGVSSFTRILGLSAR
jgi:hypothetical protein